MKNTTLVRYEFRIDPELTAEFFPLLRQGVYLPIMLGSTLQEILQCDLQIPEDYIQTRLQTIFLDNQPVDDLRKTVNTDHSSLSLSAAMPGLIGACFRRQGYYSQMRESISCASKPSLNQEKKKGVLKVKLYNFPARELGPGLLKQGVLLSGEESAVFFSDSLPEEVWKGFFRVESDGERAVPESQAAICRQVKSGWAELRVVPRPHSRQ
ncbi:MAG: hypothetical protein K9K64_02725 [Desulfohalobiaceae bacterium]|nr:hypothetical protein [Desulfohalobiaceae bacterium]